MLIRMDNLIVSIDESQSGNFMILGVRDGLSLDATLHTTEIPVDCTLSQFAEQIAEFSYSLRGFVT